MLISGVLTPSNGRGLSIQIRNASLMKAIDARGGRVGAKWCAQHQINYRALLELVNLKCSPFTSDGKMM
jgi:hypothetical protein